MKLKVLVEKKLYFAKCMQNNPGFLILKLMSKMFTDNLSKDKKTPKQIKKYLTSDILLFIYQFLQSIDRKIIHHGGHKTLEMKFQDFLSNFPGHFFYFLLSVSLLLGKLPFPWLRSLTHPI